MTVCNNKSECSQRESCKRYQSPDKGDSVQSFTPWGGVCEFYLRDETDAERIEAQNDDLREFRKDLNC